MHNPLDAYPPPAPHVPAWLAALHAQRRAAESAPRSPDHRTPGVGCPDCRAMSERGYLYTFCAACEALAAARRGAA